MKAIAFVIRRGRPVFEILPYCRVHHARPPRTWFMTTLMDGEDWRVLLHPLSLEDAQREMPRIAGDGVHFRRLDHEHGFTTVSEVVSDNRVTDAVEVDADA